MKILLTLILAAASFAQTKVNYPTDVRNGPLFSDAGPVASSLQQLCASTTSAHGTLAITRKWTAMATQNISCAHQFTGGSFSAGKTDRQ